MSNPSPEASLSRWVSIRRPPIAMTTASGGFAGGEWEFPESPPTPPRRRWHTCRPEKWGSLRRAPFHPNKPHSAVRPESQSPPSNPPPMPAVSTCLSFRDLSAFGNRTLESRGIGGDTAAGEGLTRETSDAGDGLTQACLDANNEVKILMMKMGLYVSHSDGEE